MFIETQNLLKFVEQRNDKYARCFCNTSCADEKTFFMIESHKFYIYFHITQSKQKTSLWESL